MGRFESGIESASCPVAQICSICQIDDDKSCFPPRVLEALGPQELERLLMVAYMREDAQNTALFMLSNTVGDRKHFYQGLNNLRAHLQKFPDGKAVRGSGADSSKGDTLLENP